MVTKKSKTVANTKKRDWGVAIPIVSGLGLIITIQLIVVYYMANFVPDAAPSFCNINSTVDCDAVAKTNFALLFGVPNAIWGFLFYAFVLILYFAKKLSSLKIFKFLEVFKHPKSYIFLITLLVFAADVILGYISTSVIHKICLLCFVTYFLNFILLIVSYPSKYYKKFSFSFGFIWQKLNSVVDMVFVSIGDFIEAVTNKIYAVAFFIVVICGLSALFYVNDSKIFFPPEESAFANDFSNFEPVETSNILGVKPEDAKVVINEFTDIQCPFCAMSNLLMNKVVGEYDNVTVIHHDFPLDKACNPLLKDNQMHENSCLYSQYALAAKKQGKEWGLVNAMFKNNIDLSEDKVLELASGLGLDTQQLKKDAHSKEVKKELDDEITSIIDMGIKATPTYIINGKKYDKGMLKYGELVKIIKEQGGIRKK